MNTLPNSPNPSVNPSERTAIWIPKSVKPSLINLKNKIIGESELGTTDGQLVRTLIILGLNHLEEAGNIRQTLDNSEESTCNGSSTA